mgnify:CR=1 FL=1
MLIRCNGNILIPLQRISKCEDKGGEVLIWADGSAYHATGENAKVVQALVAKIQKNGKKTDHVRKEEEQGML